MTPFLKLLSQYTGLPFVTLVAGTWADGGHVASVHWGTTKDVFPKNFSTWDKVGFRKIFCGQFLKFILANKGECQERVSVPFAMLTYSRCER